MCKKQGKYEKAESLWKQTPETVKKKYGPQHGSVASVCVRLAGLYKKQGKYEEAESLLKQALAIREKEFGPQHPKAAKVRKKPEKLRNDQKSDSDQE